MKRKKKNSQPNSATEAALTSSIADQLFPAQLTKADRRKLQILDGAIRTYASLGIDYISYEDIAREAKTSRPLVIHHFPDKRVLFELTIKLIRAQMQELAIERLKKAAGDPRAQLIAYVQSTFDWMKVYPAHPRTWLFFFYLCSSDEALRRQHRELTEQGQLRLIALLTGGVDAGIFGSGQLALKAKAIQQMITGALIEMKTELEMEALERVKEDCVKSCLLLAQAGPKSAGYS